MEKEGPDVGDNPIGYSGWRASGFYRDYPIPEEVVVTPIPTAVPTVQVTPAPGPTRLPPVVAPKGTLEELLCSFPWDCATAIRVQRCENTRQDPNAISPTGDYGIMQINKGTWKGWLNRRGFNWEEWMIPEKNVAMAYEIQRTHGWHQWTTY